MTRAPRLEAPARYRIGRAERSVVIFLPLAMRPLVAVCIPESLARTISDGATLEPNEEGHDAR